MPTLDEMRAELRALKRKAGSAVSKLKKEDVQRQLDLYRGLAEQNETEPTKRKPGRPMPPREVEKETVRHGNLEIKMPKMSVSSKKGKALMAAGTSAPVKRKKIVEVEVTDSEGEEEVVVKRKPMKPAKKVVYVESEDEDEEA